MLYPVYVHHEKGSAFGITVPDFPGCFSAADQWEDVPAMVREAVELYCEGEEMVIPEPSDISVLSEQGEYTGGQWVFVEIDPDKLQPKVVRVNITMPKNLLDSIDQYAKHAGMTRSGFLAVAANNELSQHR